MSAERHSVRRLRFDLACALAGTEYRSRQAEALAELKRVLDERGADPADSAVHLEIGRLLRRTDPATSLQHYLNAMATADDGAEHAAYHDATRGALELLDGDDSARLTATLPPQLAATVETRARAGHDAQTSLLAAKLMSQHGRADEALQVLEGAATTDDKLADAVALATARTMLELDRVDELIGFVSARSPNPELLSVMLQGMLLRGQFAEVRRLIDDAAPSTTMSDVLRTLQVLAQIGSGHWENAAAELESLQIPQAWAARAIVNLAERDYASAEEAAREFLRLLPSDPNALVLEAQVALESLGQAAMNGSGQEATPASASAGSKRNAGDELEAARQLLGAAVSRLPVPRSRLWWIRIQQVLRDTDGRFQFFDIELAAEAGDKPRLDQLIAVDSSRTTYLQDAAVAQRKAELLASGNDVSAAAAAFGAAAALWQTAQVADWAKAYRAYLAAYELQPSAQRAADRALADLQLSYRSDPAGAIIANIEADLERLREWALRSAGDELVSVLHATAWLTGRITELVPTERVARARRALEWLFAAVAVLPNDSSLAAMLAGILRISGLPNAALAFANQAVAKNAEDGFVTSTAVTILLDHSEIDEAEGLMRQESLSNDQLWCSGIRSAALVMQGRGPEVVSMYDGAEFADLPWAREAIAFARAATFGIPVEANNLGAVLGAIEPVNYSYEEVLLAGMLQDPSQIEHVRDRATTSGNLSDHDIARCQRAARFALDEGYSPQAFLDEAATAANTAGELDQLMNVDLPLLLAARTRAASPAAEVDLGVDTALFEARRWELQLSRHWADELDRLQPGLAALAQLADSASPIEPAEVSQTSESARTALRDPALAAAFDAVGNAVTARALDGLLPSLLSWRAGRQQAPDESSVGMALAIADQPISRRLVITLLAPTSQPSSVRAAIATEPLDDLLSKSSEADRAEAAGLLAAAAEQVGLTNDEWWLLDDALSAAADRDREARLVPQVRTALVHTLEQSLNLQELPTQQWPANFAFALGADFIPIDTGPDWALFSTFIPTMRERIYEDTGFNMPGCRVRGDYADRDALWLFINGSSLATRRLPSSGYVHLVDHQTGMLDPLLGRPVDVSELPGDEGEAWPALEFLMRHVERFARDHLAELIAPWHVEEYVTALGPEVADSVLSDPRQMTRWVDALRDAARRGDGLLPEAAAESIAAAAGTVRPERIGESR